MGPAERYAHEFNTQRQEPGRTWTEMEAALVATLIDWRVSCDMRPTFGDGSDCSDLMNIALARLQGLARGDLTPKQILDEYDAETEPTPKVKR